MVQESEEVSESPGDSFWVQLKHHPLPSNNASQLSHSCVGNINFSLVRTEEAAVLLGSVLIHILNDPSFSLLEFSEQK